MSIAFSNQGKGGEPDVFTASPGSATFNDTPRQIESLRIRIHDCQPVRPI
jgi:hypothetical protein